MKSKAASLIRHWSVWTALLAALAVVSFLDPFGPLYWTVLVLYVAQVVFVSARCTGPSWHRKDSRTTDGDERGE